MSVNSPYWYQGQKIIQGRKLELQQGRNGLPAGSLAQGYTYPQIENWQVSEARRIVT